MKKITLLAIGMALSIASSGIVSACPVCYGQTDSPMVAGVNPSILFMLGLTGFVLSSFSAFFVFMRRRLKQLNNNNSSHHSA